MRHYTIHATRWDGHLCDTLCYNKNLFEYNILSKWPHKIFIYLFTTICFVVELKPTAKQIFCKHFRDLRWFLKAQQQRESAPITIGRVGNWALKDIHRRIHNYSPSKGIYNPKGEKYRKYLGTLSIQSWENWSIFTFENQIHFSDSIC